MTGYQLTHRPRRLRRTSDLRRLVRESTLTIDDLIYPLFAVHGSGIKREISSLPGNYHWSVDTLVEECQRVYELGIPAVILFGIPASKDARGSEADAEDGIVQRALRAVKNAVPGLILITDVCVDEYTDHGHCGMLLGREVDNDWTLERLASVALSHVRAGADMVAPSDMMDGRVGAIRQALDKHGYTQVPVMSYAAKFASSFYGPFREAAASAPAFGDRRSYQMDPANGREARREVALDLEEGADIIMVKPGQPYLDVLHDLRSQFDAPLAVYQVSGEYAMIKAAAANGWLDERAVAMESLLAFKRAGADMILTYFAKDVANWLKD